MTIRIAIIGFGKIARDQHVPSIAADSRFEGGSRCAGCDVDGVGKGRVGHWSRKQGSFVPSHGRPQAASALAPSCIISAARIHSELGRPVPITPTNSSPS